MPTHLMQKLFLFPLLIATLLSITTMASTSTTAIDLCTPQGGSWCIAGCNAFADALLKKKNILGNTQQYVNLNQAGQAICTHIGKQVKALGNPLAPPQFVTLESTKSIIMVTAGAGDICRNSNDSQCAIHCSALARNMLDLERGNLGTDIKSLAEVTSALCGYAATLATTRKISSRLP